MKIVKRVIVLMTISLFVFACATDKDAVVFEFDFSDKATELPVPSAQSLPSSWKGFNLLDMFYKGSTWGTDKLFNEEEFKMISEFGFNFIRIPIDYRILINGGNWKSINESAMRRIDKAIEYGIKYDIHICLNLHRAPGYTVASPREKTNLWTDEAPQEAFAFIWGFIAQRYKTVPSVYLSFNFVNEPSGVEEAVYAQVIKKAADAIWEHNTDRVLIADGLEHGRILTAMIKELGIAQATRGYEPFGLTHYKADWVEGSEDWPSPTWPVFLLPRFLYGAEKSGITRSIFSIEHNFNENYYLDINVGTVSAEARLVVKADGKEIYNRLFVSGAGRGEWTKTVYNKEWDIYQNIFNKYYRIEIPAYTKLLTVEATEGDWMTVNDLKFTPVSDRGISFSVTPTSPEWGAVIPPVKVDDSGQIIVDKAFIQDQNWLKAVYLKPWIELVKSGGGAMVGEWGAHNTVPHAAVLKWMEDYLKVYKEAGLGWALWNFEGSFGIINSGRSDVEYEDYHGKKLDRKMLELLQRY